MSTPVEVSTTTKSWHRPAVDPYGNVFDDDWVQTGNTTTTPATTGLEQPQTNGSNESPKDYDKKKKKKRRESNTNNNNVDDDGVKKTYWQRFFDRNKYLLVACLILVILLNFQIGRYILYPFEIFSTFIHEMCHGVAALLTGGKIIKIQVFKNTSGLAYHSGSRNRGFVASAGYPGTAVFGFLLLLLRRWENYGPRYGTAFLGVLLLVSVAFLVRNTFGIIMLVAEGIILLLCSYFIKHPVLMENFFAFMAATCCLNALENITDLFGSSEGVVNGQTISTDAQTVADEWGGGFRIWAFLWLILSLLLFVLGIA